jgi:acetyl-CoA synthetase
VTTFEEARRFLLENRTDYQRAYTEFRWPEPIDFNWAIDWFDGNLARDASSRGRAAIWIVDPSTGRHTKLSFRELSERSNQVANWLRDLGVRRGDRLLLALGNVLPLWEVMLAAIKLGAVIIPATTLLPEDEFADRIGRGNAKYVVTSADQMEKFKRCHDITRIVVDAAEHLPGWHNYEPWSADKRFVAEQSTRANDPLLLYFTSGTTSRPKLVLHSHRSYPVGHLSTMYWIGLQPGDIHLNISSPGWAKHAWSSFFAPWNAGATVFVLNQPRFEARALLDAIRDCSVTTLCGPPTVWRLLVQQDLASWRVSLRELVGAGEPLNPEIIERVRRAWGLTIRDGYGQTETSAQVGNSPGQEVKPGSMGRPLPGYQLKIIGAAGEEAEEGEIALRTGANRPVGLMLGYDSGDPGKPLEHLKEFYRTGDVAMRDANGYLTFVGRADDVFKSSDYRISPFELESVLIEHRAIAEAAVIPSPDEIRLSVPKAFISLVPGTEPSKELAKNIFAHIRAQLAPFQRIRRIEFVKDLPKTISGKIRRVQLRAVELGKDNSGWVRGFEYVEDDFHDPRQELESDHTAKPLDSSP